MQFGGINCDDRKQNIFPCHILVQPCPAQSQCIWCERTISELCHNQDVLFNNFQIYQSCFLLRNKNFILGLFFFDNPKAHDCKNVPRMEDFRKMTEHVKWILFLQTPAWSPSVTKLLSSCSQAGRPAWSHRSSSKRSPSNLCAMKCLRVNEAWIKRELIGSFQDKWYTVTSSFSPDTDST